MRVGFDVSPLVRPHPLGVVRATRGLVDELERRTRLDVVRLGPDDGEGLRAWRQRRLPQLVHELELTGLHSPVSAFAWRGPGRRVQTVHELPWRHGVAENAGWRHRAWARLGRWRADRVLVPTEHVARDLGRSPKVTVCPWGVGPPFVDEPPPGVVDEVVLGRYRLGEDALGLCLGAVRAKKNLAAALDGLAALRASDGPRVTLVVTGENTPDLRRDLGLASRLGLARWVSTPGVVPDEDLPSLLRLAAFVVCLSRSEGFGLPVLEALACGTPVIVAAGGAPAEVAGPAGLAVDPDDAEAVADAIERAIDEREEWTWTAVDRAAEFPWSRTAAIVEDVWESFA